MSKDNVSDQEFIPEQESLRTKPSDIESDPAAGRLEDILPDIINNIPAPVVVKDQNLRVVFVNNTAGRVMGRPVGEIKGATSFGLIPEEQARLFEEKDRLVLSTGQTQTYEEPIPFGDEVYTVLATKSRYSDRATGKHYVVGVYQDITRRKRMDEKLRRIREEQSVLLRMVPAMIFWIDNEGVFIRVNEAFARAFQKSQDDICGKSLFDLYPEDMARKFHNDNMGIIESGTPQKGIEEPVWTPGGTIWVITDKMPYRDESEDVVGIVGFSVDITERKRLEEALGESEERYRAVADFTYDCEIWFGPDKEMLHVSPSSERITGYPREKFMEGLDFIERIIHKDDIPLWERHMSGISGEEDEFVEFRILHADGRIRWLSQVSRRVSGPDGATLGVRCSMRDITSRKAMEKQLRHQALHDPLTGLANRTLCLDRIQRTLERSKRRNYHYAVAFVDLDRFKVINDSFGHAYGDKLLLKVAERLAGCVRGLDTVSRFGGDEFILILDELESSKEGLGIVKRVLDDLRRPFFIEGREVRTSSSIGMVLSPSIHENPEDLLRNANIAMYRAKGSGRDRVKVFNTRMLEQAIQVMTVENDLRRAIAENEFFVQYQPIHRVNDLRLAGFEALVRWRHPQKGVIRPVEFIPAAEETGLIIDLGLWVLREACETMAAWRESHKGAEHLSLAVNLSAKQFSQPDLVEQVADILESSKLPPDRLKLEITESVIMEDAEAALSMLKRLKKIGVRLCIDDFGTGYSSLSYLQRFLVDTLKVDRSFIRHMGTDQADVEIVRTVVVLAQSLGMDVIAEGVEKEEQLSVLKTLNCEYVQGFYFFKPLDLEESEKLICDLDRP